MMAWWLLPVDRLLEKQLKSWLLEQGIEADFRIVRLTTNHLEFRDIILLPHEDVAASRITATYALSDLGRKRIDRLEIEGLRLHAVRTDEGTPHIESLAPLLSAATEPQDFPALTLPALPFNVLEAKDVQLTYTPQEGSAYNATLSLTLSQDYTGKLVLDEARLPLGGEDSILLQDATIQRGEADATFAVDIGRIAHITGQRAYFTPLRTTGTLTPARDNRQLDGIMTVTDIREQLTVDIRGGFALDTGEWHVEFEQPTTTFETGILQPDMLFPLLRGHVAQMEGSIAVSGSARKTAEDSAVVSRGELRAQGLGGVIMDIPVSGVNGTIALSSLWPPATDGQQRLSVREILLGLPLKNGRMAMTLKPDGNAIFAPGTWEWAGGTLHTDGVTFNIHSRKLPDITLSAKGLALEELLSGLLQKGVSASGKLDGVIPVHFTAAGDALIRNGKLTTYGGGTIRYLPDTASPLQKGHSFQTDLLLSAVEDFHYETLSMTINSTGDRTLNVLLHVKGRNPQLYGGQSIELNINLTGNLLDIVQSGMNIYTLPERLQEQLMQ